MCAQVSLNEELQLALCKLEDWKYFPVLSPLPSPRFHLLSPFYWHCHWHSMRATDWMRRWVRVRRVRYCLLCVCFLPPFVGVQRRRWASDNGPRPSVPGAHEYSPSCIAWANISPPRFGLCVDLSPTYCTYAVFGVCVLENPVGQMCPLCCNPVFKVPTIWCIYSCNSPSAETELTLVF